VQSYLSKGIDKNNDASYSIDVKNMNILTGLTEADILEGLQQLPGVVSINNTATGLSVRGGNTDQNLIIWDNINIYHPGHLFGLVSVFNPNVVQDIKFINKGTNPKYGGRISSVIDINTTNKIAKKNAFEIGLNAISADAVLTLPIIKNKLSLQTSFRRSFEDVYETKTFYNYEHQAFQHTNIVEEKFHFKDYNLKFNYLLDAKNKIALSVLHIDNDLENDANSETNNENYIDIIDTENDGYSLNWKHHFEDNKSLTTALNYSHFRLDYNSKVLEGNLLITDYFKENSIIDYGFSSDYNIHKKNNRQLLIGYQFSYKSVYFNIRDYRSGIFYNLDKDDSSISTHSIYTNYKFTKNTWTVNSGLRLNYYTNLEQASLEPRLVINKKISPSLNFQMTAEIKSQIVKQIDETVLSDLSKDTKLWRLVDGVKHPKLKTRQLSAGIVYTKNNWLIDFDTYYKKTKGIAALSLGFLNPLDNTVHIGNQKSYGLDIYVQRRIKGFNIWTSYSYMDVKNNYEGLNNNKAFTANTEIKHMLTSAISYSKKRIQTGISCTFRTGKPLTDLDYDSNGSAYFDGINTENLNNYFRIDASATYKFKLGSHTKGKIGISLKNITNRKNHINTIFAGNNTVNDPIIVSNRYSYGITPNFLLRFYW
jgi:hypothetical protein